jgi:hypothetical protein
MSIIKAIKILVIIKIIKPYKKIMNSKVLKEKKNS